MTQPGPSPLDRALRVFGDVRSGEAGTTLLLLVNLFILLVSYYILKTVREPLILATGGAKLKSYAGAGQALILIGLVPLYGWLAAHVDRLRLITWVTCFFVADIALFNIGMRLGVPYLGIVFFVWVGIFSLATIAQFWSYANDLFRREDGERLFPLIAVGATGGSWAGSRIAELLFRARWEPSTILNVAAVLLAVHLVLYFVIDRRLGAASPGGAAAARLSGPGGFTLVLQSRYLKLIAVLLVLLNVVNTTGEYIIGESVTALATASAGDDLAARRAFIGAFYGSYFFWVNVSAVVLQAFVASRLVKVAGLAGVLLALPLVALGVYGLVGLGVAFPVVRWAKTAENATDYSIMNTARQMLWLPTSREEKYKAKQALDTFFVRAGDVMSALFVLLGTQVFGLGVSGFAWINVGLGGAWLLVAFAVLAENRRLVGQTS